MNLYNKFATDSQKKKYKKDMAKYKKYQQKAENRQLLTLGGMALIAPFLYKSMQGKSLDKKRKNRMEKIRAAAIAQNPVVSLDTDLYDNKRERDLEQLGMLAKQSNEGDSVLDKLQDLKKGSVKALGIGDKNKSDMFPAVALLTLLGVGHYAANKADKSVDIAYSNKLDKQIKDLKNDLDATQFYTLAEQRNLVPHLQEEESEPNAIVSNPRQVQEEEEPNTSKQMSSKINSALRAMRNMSYVPGSEREYQDTYPEREQQDTYKGSQGLYKISSDLVKTGGIVKTFKQAYPLVALAVMYGGYKAGRNMAKSEDNTTEAYKEFEQMLREKYSSPTAPQIRFEPGGQMEQLFGTNEEEEEKRPEELEAGSADII